MPEIDGLELGTAGDELAGIAFLIPAFNPAERLASIVAEIRAGARLSPIIVVDDGCGPDYASLFERIRGIPDVEVVSNAVNLGKGAALKHGLNHLLTRFTNVVGVVTADADGQHAVSDILRVADALRRNPKSFVLGAREFGPQTPARSKVGNNVSRVLYRALLGLNLRDTQTGLRGLPLDLARRSLRIRSNRYEFETEQLVAASSARTKIEQVPIQTIYEDHNASSHFNPLLDSLRIYFVVLRYAVSSIATALVDLVTFTAAMTFLQNVLVSNLLARVVALGLQFFLLKTFVFHARGGGLRYVAFVAYVMIMGLVSTALQVQLSSATGAGVVVSKLLVETAVFVFNFLFLRDFLFARPVDEDESD